VKKKVFRDTEDGENFRCLPFMPRGSGIRILLPHSQLLRSEESHADKSAFLYARPYAFHAGVLVAALRFTVILEPAEEGGFVSKCVELPVASQGESRDEALRNAKEAIEAYLEVKGE
jgi:hypothetical protein